MAGIITFKGVIFGYVNVVLRKKSLTSAGHKSGSDREHLHTQESPLSVPFFVPAQGFLKSVGGYKVPQISRWV